MNHASCPQWRFDLAALTDAEPLQLTWRWAPLDKIHGTPGDDTLNGTWSDDKIHGGKGADLMSGGTGSDRYWVDNEGDLIVEEGESGEDTVYAKVSYTLPAYVEGLVLEGHKALVGYGNSGYNFLAGNDAGNVLYGEAGYDTLVGNAGDDTLHGGGDWDRLDGGAGNDVLYAGSGYYDELRGGGGDDAMYGQGGDDEFFDAQNDGNDTIAGGDGNRDYLIADWAAATGDIVWVNDLTEQEVNGQVVSGIERVHLMLGAGNDVYVAYAFANTYLEGGAGNDSLLGSAGYSALHGGAGNDTLRGSALLNLDGVGFAYGDDGNDLIVAGGTGWEIEGGGGNDTVIGGAGGDQINGGAGDDLLTAKGDDVADRLRGDAGNDTLVGSALDEEMQGGAGADSMSGGAGDDSFSIEHSEADTVHGGEGFDSIDIDWSDATADIVWINDPVQQQLVNGSTFSGIEAITALLGSGNDTLINVYGDGTVFGGAGNDSIAGTEVYGEAGNDTLVGTQRGDLHNGGTGDDLLVGSDGKDTLIGSTGSDSLSGGGGDDSVYGGNFFADELGTSDSGDGGSGIDCFIAHWHNETASVELTADGSTHTVYGDTFRNFEKFVLNMGRGNDTVTAGNDDTVDGGQGNDVLRGGRIIAGGFGKDSIVGDAGDDLISGGDDNDTLHGGAGNDELTDDHGRNRMDGGAGDDTFVSGLCSTTMTGGGGADRFFAGWFSTHTVLDFVSGLDRAGVLKAMVGNGNDTINDAIVVDGPGGFSKGAELVIVTADIDGAITLDAAAAAIGSATSAYGSFEEYRLFVVDNGIDTGVFLFQSSGADALVSADELWQLMTLKGVAETAVDDYLLY